MATQRYISTSFWDDAWISTLDPSEKLLYLYLMTNPLTNIAGVYEITIRRISFDTGFNIDMITKILDRFMKDCKAYYYNDYIIIPSWPKHQKWETRSKIKQGIDKIISSLPDKICSYMVSIGYQYDTNYLDLDLDPDSNNDPDLEVEQEGVSASVRTNELIKYWNTKTNLPHCPYVSATLPRIADVTEKLNVFSVAEIEKAIDNLSELFEMEEAKYRPSSLQNFIANSIDRWVDSANPKSRYKKQEEDMTKKNYAEGWE